MSSKDRLITKYHYSEKNGDVLVRKKCAIPTEWRTNYQINVRREPLENRAVGLIPAQGTDAIDVVLLTGTDAIGGPFFRSNFFVVVLVAKSTSGVGVETALGIGVFIKGFTDHFGIGGGEVNFGIAATE